MLIFWAMLALSLSALVVPMSLVGQSPPNDISTGPFDEIEVPTKNTPNLLSGERIAGNDHNFFKSRLRDWGENGGSEYWLRGNQDSFVPANQIDWQNARFIISYCGMGGPPYGPSPMIFVVPIARSSNNTLTVYRGLLYQSNVSVQHLLLQFQFKGNAGDTTLWKWAISQPYKVVAYKSPISKTDKKSLAGVFKQKYEFTQDLYCYYSAKCELNTSRVKYSYASWNYGLILLFLYFLLSFIIEGMLRAVISSSILRYINLLIAVIFGAWLGLSVFLVAVICINCGLILGYLRTHGWYRLAALVIIVIIILCSWGLSSQSVDILPAKKSHHSIVVLPALIEGSELDDSIADVIRWDTIKAMAVRAEQNPGKVYVKTFMRYGSWERKGFLGLQRYRDCYFSNNIECTCVHGSRYPRNVGQARVYWADIILLLSFAISLVIGLRLIIWSPYGWSHLTFAHRLWRLVIAGVFIGAFSLSIAVGLWHFIFCLFIMVTSINEYIYIRHKENKQNNN